ncbi:MAG: phosphatase PAP2 family protein [FCB group bacterium]|jgi:membrane-associated phospholipid phosphatase
MKTYLLKSIILAFWGICLVNQVYSQSTKSDSSFHPYHVNYWVTGTICGVGLITNYLGIPKILHKADVTTTELQALNKDIINSFDSWAFKQDPSKIKTFENYSNYTLTTTVVLPALLLFDKKIMQDWGDILLIYLETISVTSNIYAWSFLGPTFQNKFRPATYYNQLTYVQRQSGDNRNSFYSGHVASAAAATFLMVKVYSDYNPSIGDNKYFLYAAAAVPPLILGYLRVKALQHFPSDVLVGFGVGAVCGIIIPELHHLQDKNIALGLYSSPVSTGIAINWQPDFFK